MSVLRENWTNFFNMTRTAGATLIGLLFVTVTLVSGLSKSQSAAGMRAFLTPTLLNFSGVLFQALVVLAPGQSHRPGGVVFILAGLASLGYRISTLRFKRGLDFIKPQQLDWIPYDAVPMLGSVSLVAGGVGLLTRSSIALYAIAASSVLLLASGIYGAWDLTLWMVENRKDT